jgi:hypothetical protein
LKGGAEINRSNVTGPHRSNAVIIRRAGRENWAKIPACAVPKLADFQVADQGHFQQQVIDFERFCCSIRGYSLLKKEEKVGRMEAV